MKGAVAAVLPARAARAFGDGFTALLLPVYLSGLGLNAFQVGLVTTATLLGSAAATLAVGVLGHRLPARRLLLAASILMLFTGLAFSQARAFWPLMIVGFVGTLNPSGGDVSVFVPLEQAMLAHVAAPSERTAIFARYGLIAALTAATGALATGLLEPIGAATGLPRQALIQGAFALYGLIGAVIFLIYRRLPRLAPVEEPERGRLGKSRRHIFVLAALFSVDSFGGGFLVQSLLALWLFQHFGLSLAMAGAFFFWSGVLAAFSQLAASRLARRIGLINTMVFTHVPANLCMVAAAFAPNLAVALSLLLVRAALSQMDVPARTSYVLATVTAPERTAAAGVTNVPRSLAAALSPTLAGLLFGASHFAWPLVIGGALKLAYDMALLAMFRRVKPPEEEPATTRVRPIGS